MGFAERRPPSDFELSDKKKTIKSGLEIDTGNRFAPPKMEGTPDKRTEYGSAEIPLDYDRRKTFKPGVEGPTHQISEVDKARIAKIRENIGLPSEQSGVKDYDKTEKAGANLEVTALSGGTSKERLQADTSGDSTKLVAGEARAPSGEQTFELQDDGEEIELDV